MTRVAIFDYGAGNIFSLQNSLRREGAEPDVIRNLDGAQANYDGLLLPGVGHFDPAMRAVSRASGEGGFEDCIGDGMPILGICLGMEMFFASSDEGSERGLGVLDGRVRALPDTMKVPHMGWNSLRIRNPDSVLLKGVADGSWVYFVHSYVASFADAADAAQSRKTAGDPSAVTTSESDYNHVMIPASVEHGNYFGTQFHPEKSGAVGRIMLRNFLGACRR